MHSAWMVVGLEGGGGLNNHLSLFLYFHLSCQQALESSERERSHVCLFYGFLLTSLRPSPAVGNHGRRN